MPLIFSHSLLIIVSFFLSLSSHAESKVRRAIIFGGGCEKEGRNRFVPIMTEQAKGLSKHGWEITPLLAHETQLSEKKLLAEASGLKSSTAQNATKKSLLNALDSVLTDPRFKDGGALLISFNTHGRPKADGSGHQLCVQTDIDDENPVEISLDDPEILARLNAIKKNNIKMGFTDMSCYSGASIPILREFGCVISSQTDNLTSVTYGVSGSVAKLLNMPNNNTKKLALSSNGRLTLEDVYLDTLLHGDSYKVKGGSSSDTWEHILQPTSSLFDVSTPVGQSIINILFPREGRLPLLSSTELCQLQKNSQLQIDHFLSALITQINHSLLEDLSGRQLQELTSLKQDLQDRINHRIKIQEHYKALSEEENEVVNKLSAIGFFSAKIDLSDEMKLIGQNLEHAIKLQTRDLGDTISIQNGIMNIKAPAAIINQNVSESEINEQAQGMHKFLMMRTEIPAYAISPKSVPSAENLKSLLINIHNVINKSPGTQIDQINTLKNRKNQLASELFAMKMNFPFLMGHGQNDISRDLNLLKADAYLTQRQKWMNSPEKPDNYKACAEFELN